jgi:hypothetical protein
MKRLKLIAVIFALEILFSGCIKEYYTLNSAILVNSTSYYLTVLPFNIEGIVSPSDTLHLPPHDSIVILKDRSLSEKSGVDWKGATGPLKEVSDAAIVIFDDSFSVTHYY